MSPLLPAAELSPSPSSSWEAAARSFHGRLNHSPPLAGMRSHARAPLCSLAATCLFHPAELFPTINFNLAWALPLQPDLLGGWGWGGGSSGFLSLPSYMPGPVC